MRKSILAALLTVAGLCALSDHANAGSRRYNGCGCGCGNSQMVAPAATVTAPMPVSADSSAAPSTTSTYQSNSYEPNSSQAVAIQTPVQTYRYVAPTYRQSNYSEYNSVLRGDKKVRPNL